MPALDPANNPIALMQGALKDEDARMASLDKQQGALESQLSDVSKHQEERDQRAEGRYDKALDSLKPPQYQPIPSPTVKSTDPKTIWSSSAMWLAGLGSLMARQPLTTAMNAAAMAIKGFHEGDQEAAKQALETWKIANENYNKAFDYEMSTYKDALGRAEHHLEFEEKQSSQEANTEEREIMARVNALGRAYQNEFTSKVRTIQELNSYMENMDRQKEAKDKSAGQVMAEVAVTEAMTDWVQQHPHATPMEKAHAFTDILAQAGPHAANAKSTMDAHLEAAYKDPRIRTQQLAKLEASVPGKQYETAKAAYGQVEDLARDPEIANNPVKQLGLIDKVIFMETGSIRPALAQYQKLLGATTGRDVWDMVIGRVAHHPILGHDQIRNLASAATDLAKSAEQSYQEYVASPEHADVARRLDIIDDDGKLRDQSLITRMGGEGGGKQTAPPAVGAVQKGFRFKGGDPSKKENWEKVSG